jgi:4-hydroxy-tetrahydrodipicolinate synthase
VRLLFQDYAPIPAQKALLARQLGQPSWNNLRPPMQPMATDKLTALADALDKEFGMKF